MSRGFRYTYWKKEFHVIQFPFSDKNLLEIITADTVSIAARKMWKKRLQAAGSTAIMVESTVNKSLSGI